MRDLYCLSLPATRYKSAIAGWLLEARGQGDKLRQVALVNDVILDLQNYIAARGLNPDLRDPPIGEAHLARSR